jgi:hypothetical protein
VAGEFSRTGNYRGLNAALSIGGTSGSNLADQLAAISTAITAGTTAVTSLATATVTVGRQIPSGSVILAISTSGTNAEAFITSGSTASGATSITTVSQTANRARAIGDLIVLLQVPQPYIALYTATPADNTLGTEYTATGYARQAITWTLPTAADPPNTWSTSQLTFGPMTGGTGSSIGWASAMELSSGGTAANMQAWWTLTNAKNPGVNDSVVIASGSGGIAMSLQ